MLKTPRLVLRRHTEKDLNASYHMWSDERVARFTTGQVASRQQCWSRILSYVGHWDLKNFGFWAMEEKTSGQFVGELGFAYFERGIQSPFAPLPEIGWAVTPGAQGKGYASEGIEAALSWGKLNLPAKEIFCIIDPGNSPSLKLASKFELTWRHDVQYLQKTLKLFTKVL